MLKLYLLLSLLALLPAANALETDNSTSSSTSPLSQDDLFTILAAEFSIHRDQYPQALGFYLQQAKTQQNAYLAERATQLALHEKKYADMLEAAIIWKKAAPNNELAHFFTSLAYGFNMQPNIALENMRKVLQLQGETDFTRLVNLLPQGSSSEPFYIQELLQATKLHPNSYDASLALALLYQRQDQEKLSLHYTDKTLENVGSNMAALEYVIRLYDKYHQRTKALNAYQAAVEADPHNLLLRHNYAQYAIQYDIDIAKTQFEYILSRQADDDYALLSLGLIALEKNQLSIAEQQFLQLQQSGKRTSAANYYLGEVYKRQGKLDEALTAFSSITSREEAMRANEQIIGIYITQNRFADADALINSSLNTTGSAQYSEQLNLLNVANLEKQGKIKEAYQLLSKLLVNNPDSFQLRYSRAMLAETNNELGQMESDLRHIINIYPDSALALNALGYTLADKTNRYNEALELIKQAQKLVPEDPSILDSLGWVLFRMGKVNEAVEYLQHALSLLPDAEVAAHLGEALWVLGKKDAARKVFKDALHTSPNHTTLLETIKRLNVGL
jgi:tetratricopeptide (TPR) repeat protein